jgi:DNA-directed RNA polymerase specialized sigma24 family protein
MTGDRHQAEDAVQAVYARLAAKDLGEVEHLFAYARRALYNECASWRRGLARRRRRDEQLQAEWERSLRCQPDPHGRVEVLSALLKLPVRRRAAGSSPSTWCLTVGRVILRFG